jgi:hypothetical protein
MPDRNPWRTTQRYAIDADLLAELEREATALAIPLERYVEQVLLSVLPSVLASTMTSYANRSIALAAHFDQESAMADSKAIRRHPEINIRAIAAQEKP